jgi:hypothetical protein
MLRYRFTLLALLTVAGLPLLGGAPPHAAAADGVVNPAVFREPAPELTGTRWLNVTGKEHPSLTKPKAKVTVVHFWTFG